MAEPSSPRAKEDAAPRLEEDGTTLDKGLDALNGADYDRAAEIFGTLLKQSVEKHGELAVESALPGYYYGVSLLNVAQTSREVFARDGATEGQLFESAEQEGEEASDLALAWEALECARHAFEHSTASTNHSQLADVYVALGDVACETSSFDSALKEYRAAISHLEKCDDQNDQVQDHVGGVQRRFCEVYYKMCLACEFLQDLTQAAEYCEHAITAIRQEIASADNAAELKEIERDLLEKREEMAIGLQETEQVKDFLRQMMEKNLQPVDRTEAEGTPVDLGVVGRGKNRIRPKPALEPLQKEASPGKPLKRASSEQEEDGTASVKKTKLEEEGKQL